MNTRKVLVVAVLTVLLLAIAVPLAGAAAAGVTVVPFSGTEYLVALLYAGDVNENDHVMTLHNRLWDSYEDADNSCVTGPSNIITNAVYAKKPDKMEIWGSFTLRPEGYDGTWEGQWRSEEDGIKMKAHGTGELAGLTGEWTYTSCEGDEDALLFTGEIRVPPGAKVQCEE